MVFISDETREEIREALLAHDVEWMRVVCRGSNLPVREFLKHGTCAGIGLPHERWWMEMQLEGGIEVRHVDITRDGIRRTLTLRASADEFGSYEDFYAWSRTSDAWAG